MTLIFLVRNGIIKFNLNQKKKYESCEKKFKKSLIILGDSHSLDVFNSISKVTKYDFVYGIGTPEL